MCLRPKLSDIKCARLFDAFKGKQDGRYDRCAAPLAGHITRQSLIEALVTLYALYESVKNNKKRVYLSHEEALDHAAQWFARINEIITSGDSNTPTSDYWSGGDLVEKAAAVLWVRSLTTISQ